MARRKTLRVPLEGPCAGHPCDACPRCATDCCGADVGEAGLPLEGSWPFEFHGSCGVLRRNNAGALRCHCCGAHHEDLSKHVRAHGLTADAYRAMWGLNSTTALCSERLRSVKRELGRQHGHRLSAGDALLPTSEQRSRWSKNREARAETRLRRGEQPRSPLGQWLPPTPGTPITARLAPKRQDVTP